MTVFDVIVVGGGSAGCLVAATLSADPRRRVCLLEAGPPAEDNPETLRADGYKDAFANDRVVQERYSVPQPGCGGRRLFAGTGRGLGGSGGINGMVYTRGAALDYATWPVGWRWDDLIPSFRDLEALLTPHTRPPTAWTEAFLEAAVQSGFRRSADLNDGDLSGVMGYEWMNYAGEQRRSSYVAALAPALRRPNLVVAPDTVVRRVTFEARRATGVEISRRGRTEHLQARHVVLCAGALETPKLLMLSGVGPGDHLRAHGIDVVHDSAGVGANLHDHPNVQLFFRGAPVDCAYPQVYGFHRANPDLPLPPEQADTCYVAWPARSALREALLRMLPALALPHRMRKAPWAKAALRAPVRAAFQLPATRAAVDRIWGVVVILGKPFSRGSLRLASADVHDDAHLDPAWLSDPRDLTTMLRGVARARALARSPALAAWGNQELLPGALVRREDWLAAWVRSQVMTTYHFAGTVRMGDDDDAPADPTGAVRGVEGLTVADASLIPETPVSALNAPSMVIGLKVARGLAARQA